MVMPAFTDLDVELWFFRGRLGGSGPVTLCLYHREVQLGSSMLDALAQLARAKVPVLRTITFAPGKRKNALHALKLLLVPERDELKVMNIRRDEQSAIIEMTAVGLGLVTEAVGKWVSGLEDFGVAPDQADIPKRKLGTLDRSSAELWFWGPYYAPEPY